MVSRFSVRRVLLDLEIVDTARTGIDGAMLLAIPLRVEMRYVLGACSQVLGWIALAGLQPGERRHGHEHRLMYAFS